MISGDEKDVAGFMASLVDSSDSFVGGRNGFNGGVINTSVTNLQ